MTLLAHISDLHLNGTRRNAERVKRVADHLRALPTPPDALLVTGDITDHGAASEFREAAELLSAPFPVLYCPGNHDDRSALRSVLLDEPGDGAHPFNTVHRVDGITVLMCDSTIPGQDQGYVAESTVAWIDAVLQDPKYKGPALLAMHHPPVPVHHPMPDSCPLTNPEAVADVLERHPQIIAVLNGHAHTAAASGFASRPVLMAPGVTWMLPMPPHDDAPIDLDGPVGYALHTIDGGQIVTHFRAVPATAVSPGDAP